MNVASHAGHTKSVESSSARLISHRRHWEINRWGRYSIRLCS